MCACVFVADTFDDIFLHFPGADRGLCPIKMSGANPTTAAGDPPPLANVESGVSDKNDAKKYGSEENREVAMTCNDANEVKSGYEPMKMAQGDENGTECVADEANIVEIMIPTKPIQ